MLSYKITIHNFFYKSDYLTDRKKTNWKTDFIHIVWATENFILAFIS